MNNSLIFHAIKIKNKSFKIIIKNVKLREGFQHCIRPGHKSKILNP